MTVAVEASRYDNRDRDDFDFTRVVGDALHARTSHSVGENGGAVPFELMETLGGANSIRGFKEYRFRDTRNLLLNAEYRWEGSGRMSTSRSSTMRGRCSRRPLTWICTT